jgi:hypothetical protein
MNTCGHAPGTLGWILQAPAGQIPTVEQRDPPGLQQEGRVAVDGSVVDRWQGVGGRPQQQKQGKQSHRSAGFGGERHPASGRRVQNDTLAPIGPERAKIVSASPHFSHSDWSSRLPDARCVGVFAIALSSCGLKQNRLAVLT